MSRSNDSLITHYIHPHCLHSVGLRNRSDTPLACLPCALLQNEAQESDADLVSAAAAGASTDEEDAAHPAESSARRKLASKKEQACDQFVQLGFSQISG